MLSKCFIILIISAAKIEFCWIELNFLFEQSTFFPTFIIQGGSGSIVNCKTRKWPLYFSYYNGKFWVIYNWFWTRFTLISIRYKCIFFITIWQRFRSFTAILFVCSDSDIDSKTLLTWVSSRPQFKRLPASIISQLAPGLLFRYFLNKFFSFACLFVCLFGLRSALSCLHLQQIPFREQINI